MIFNVYSFHYNYITLYSMDIKSKDGIANRSNDKIIIKLY